MHLFLFLFFVIICASGKFFDFLFIEYNCVGPLDCGIVKGVLDSLYIF